MEADGARRERNEPRSSRKPQATHHTCMAQDGAAHAIPLRSEAMGPPLSSAACFSKNKDFYLMISIVAGNGGALASASLSFGLSVRACATAQSRLPPDFIGSCPLGRESRSGGKK
eukprot:1146602-Amphidinium_carterae.1